MVYCKTCDAFFDEDYVIKTDNHVPYGLSEVKESTSTECPYCGSNELEFEVTPVLCACCNDVIPNTHAFRDRDYYYCEHCYDNGVK